MSDYQNKTQVHSLNGVVSGSFLKWEATRLSRVAVPAAPGTKAGTFVDYPLRGKKLLALTDEADGKVLVQPHNCIIDVSLLEAAAVNAAASEGSFESLQKDGDAYGIVYAGTPKA